MKTTIKLLDDMECFHKANEIIKFSKLTYKPFEESIHDIFVSVMSGFSEDFFKAGYNINFIGHMFQISNYSGTGWINIGQYHYRYYIPTVLRINSVSKEHAFVDENYSIPEGIIAQIEHSFAMMDALSSMDEL